jgi:hypothetical protein
MAWVGEEGRSTALPLLHTCPSNGNLLINDHQSLPAVTVCDSHLSVHGTLGRPQHEWSRGTDAVLDLESSLGAFPGLREGS